MSSPSSISYTLKDVSPHVQRATELADANRLKEAVASAYTAKTNLEAVTRAMQQRSEPDKWIDAALEEASINVNELYDHLCGLSQDRNALDRQASESSQILAGSTFTPPPPRSVGQSNAGGTSYIGDEKKQPATALQEEEKEFYSIVESFVVKKIEPLEWTDIFGADEAKEAFQERLNLFMTAKQAQLKKSLLKEDKANNLILVGPPGTGKTSLGKALHTAITKSGVACTFYNVTCAGVMSKWVGVAPKIIKYLFQHARAQTKSLLYFDEVECLLAKRSTDASDDSSKKLMSTFLDEAEGVAANNENLIIVSNTNLPWDVDGAARRRFGKMLYVPLPNLDDRVALLRRYLCDPAYRYYVGNCAPFTDDQLIALASQSEHFSPSDFTVMFRDIQQIRFKELKTLGRARFVNGKYYMLREREKDEKDEKDDKSIPFTFADFEALYDLDKVKDTDLVMQPCTYREVERAIQSTAPTSRSEDVEHMETFLLKAKQES